MSDSSLTQAKAQRSERDTERQSTIKRYHCADALGHTNSNKEVCWNFQNNTQPAKGQQVKAGKGKLLSSLFIMLGNTMQALLP